MGSGKIEIGGHRTPYRRKRLILGRLTSQVFETSVETENKESVGPVVTKDKPRRKFYIGLGSVN